MQTRSSRLINSGTVLLFLLFTAGISAAANVDVVSRFGGVVDAVDIDGNYAYIGEGQNFVVLDISDPFNPLKMGSVTASSAINRINIAGSYAYLTSPHNGLSIVDISDPAAPILKGSYDTSGLVSDVAVSGNYAYIADADNGLLIADITDPAAPTFVTNYNTDNLTLTMGVAISGNYVYVTDVVKGLTILDITDPTAPALAGSHDIGGARDVAVAGNYAYLTQYDGGLFAIDITDPSSTTLVGGHNIDDPSDIALAGNYAYVADGDGGLIIVDITTPSSLTGAGTYIAASAHDVDVAGNYAYIAAGDDGLVILDSTNPSSITAVGTYVTTVSAKGVAVADDHAYIIDDKKGLVIANITDLSSPRFVTNYSIAGSATDIAVSGNYSYLADPNNGLLIINITDPAAPTLAGVYATTNNAQGVDVEGNYAYVADYNNGLLILDITDPTAPAFAGIYAGADNAEDIDVAGNFAYVADNSIGLVIVDITDPAAPAFVGSYTPSDWIRDVAVAGNYAYVAEVNYGLRILDITNPAAPVLVGSYFTGCCVNKISVSGNYAQVAYFSGLDIVDISNPSSPTLAGSYDSAHYIHGVFASGNCTYVAEDDMGLAILCGEVVSTATTYTPDYDNRLRKSSPNTVLSSSNYIDIGRLGTTSYRDVMWFDLSGYTSFDTISKATLSLYWYYPSSTRTSDTVVEVYRPLEWSPQYVTWNSRMSGILWDTAGGNWFDKNGVPQGTTPYASVAFSAGRVPDNKYYEFDVTQLVQEYVSGTYENTGFFLKAQTESGNYIAFYSSDWSNADQRPKLTITSTSGSADNLPVASAGDDTIATTGSPVSFDGSGSTDDKGIASYSWDFDDSDGITSEVTGPTATKTYATAGTYTVTLTVTDTAGQASADTLQVVVTDPVSSVTYTPTYDNRLRESTPTTVLSNYNYIDIGKLGTTRYRDVMLFDLSDYKATDTISKATLSLYWYYPTSATRTSDTVVEIYRPVEWNPKYVSWSSCASGISWSTAGGNWYDKNGVAQGTAPYASVTFPAGTVPDNQYHEFDVTQLVQEYISVTYDNTGFFLKAQTESGNYIAFYSSDWSNADQRPKLTINS